MARSTVAARNAPASPLPSAAASGREAPGLSPQAAERWVALDRLRATSLLLMLFHHLTRWLSGETRGVIPSIGAMTVTDVAAPAFALTAGASVVLFVRARRSVPVNAGETASVLRRYGLLVPIGVALVWVVSGDPWEFGVLQMLGVTTVIAYGVFRATGAPGLMLAGVVVLGLGPHVERMADRHLTEGTLGHNVLGDIFPLATYAGFVLVGASVAALARRAPRWPPAAAAAAVLAVPISALFVAGDRPSRYPGDALFLLVSLAAALGMYAGLARWRPRVGNPFDTVLRAAARHTFGVYVGHYAVFFFVDRFHLPHAPVGLAMVLAVVGTAVITLVAPFVPPPPVSLRGVQRRVRPTDSVDGGATAPGRDLDRRFPGAGVGGAR